MDDVWSTPFSPEMLEICPNLIIACPREEIAFELMEILEDHHVKWAGIEAPTNKTRWGDNREETVYFVEDRRLTFCYMNYVNQTSAYDSYTKCTFLWARLLRRQHKNRASESGRNTRPVRDLGGTPYEKVFPIGSGHRRYDF